MCYDAFFFLTWLFGPSGVRLCGRRRLGRHNYKERQFAFSSIRIMETNYDEDIAENLFFLKLKEDYPLILKEVIEQGWIICVPRCGTFNDFALLKEDVLGHVLLSHDNFDSSTFYTLNGRKIRLENKVLTVENGVIGCCTSYLLFEETFYTKDKQKYRVWCLEQPLSPARQSLKDDLTTVTNLQECMNLLWTEVHEKSLLKELESIVKDFISTYSNLDQESLIRQKDLIGTLYEECLGTIIRDSKLKQKATSSRFFLNNVKVAIETYILYELKNVLPKSIATCMASEDAKLNKMLRNLQEVQPSDLGIRNDLLDSIPRGKLELSRLNNLSTVLGKTECLKRTVHYMSEGAPSVSSDDLLPVLIFLVIKVGLPNWMTQLSFLKHFRFSANSTLEADQTGFLVTSLEAAIEHISSDKMNNCLSIELDECDLPNLPTQGLSSSDDRDEMSLSCLFHAIKRGELSEVHRILSVEGVEGNQNDNDETILCHPLCRCDSCERKRKNSLKCPVTVETKDERGISPLHVASSFGRISIVDFLLNHGANVNETDADGLTPLHYACISGHQATILLLLYAKADPTLADSRGNTALHLATDRGHEDCVKALLYFAEQTGFPLEPDPVNVHGDTPLHYAAKWAYRGIAEILIEHGANIRLSNKRGLTPLSLAHNPRIAEILETSSTNMRHHVKSIFVPTISYSQYQGSSKRSKSEERVEKSSRVKKNMLEDCSQDKNKDMRKVAEEDEEVEDEKKKRNEQHRINRLFSAIREGDVRLARYYLGLELLESLRARKKERTLCHPLCDCERCSGFYSSSSEDSAEECRRRESECLANLSRMTNAYNEDGECALHVAAASGFVDIVRALLEAGADVNARTRLDGRTALHIASMKNKLEVVRLLLNSTRCEINAKDCQGGDTALHLALKAGHKEVAVYLIRNGANSRMANSCGLTALLIIDGQNRVSEFTTIRQMIEKFTGLRKYTLNRSKSLDFTDDLFE